MFLCDRCDKEFPQTPQGKQEWLLHRASHNQVTKETGMAGGKPMSAADIKKQMIEEKKKEKLVLEYVWRGVCPTCGTPSETIEVDVGQPKGKTVVVAFCSSCKKQLAYRPVEKL